MVWATGEDHSRARQKSDAMPAANADRDHPMLMPLEIFFMTEDVLFHETTSEAFSYRSASTRISVPVFEP